MKPMGIFLLLLGLGGCISPGPHLFFGRDTEQPDEQPEEPPIAEPGLIPPLTEDAQLAGGSGGGAYRGEIYHGFGGSGFVFGGESRGDLYRMVAPSLSLGARNGGEAP